ncbi:MAG: spore photoproduct lyase [bacterium]|jgi:spore photoproduct lyase
MTFSPQQIFVEKKALEYELGRSLLNTFRQNKIQTRIYDRRLPSTDPNLTARERFMRFKRTLVVGIWRQKEFQTCKPSAHYQLPLVSGCPGLCQYCYLATNLSKRPYIKVYVNTEDIFDRARDYIRMRNTEETIFEASATSDPIAVEKWTGSLKKAIEFTAQTSSARLRFVTKFADVETLLGLDHRQKTEVRFSINVPWAVERFEQGVPPVRRRLEAAARVQKEGYPVGILIAPIFVFPDWQRQYDLLIKDVAQLMPDAPVTFELITHRFTARAKSVIKDVFPKSELPLAEEERQLKYGQFGYTKFVYPRQQMKELESFFRDRISTLLPRAQILYFV